MYSTACYSCPICCVLWKDRLKNAREERFGITSQLRRAAVSVPANIAEGFKRRSPQEKVRFYNISQASLEEARYYLILVTDLEFIERPRSLIDLVDETALLLNGLMESVRVTT